MPTFIGFSTIDQNKKFTAVDFDLIKIDLLNAFNIRQGELVGRPGYGMQMFPQENGILIQLGLAVVPSTTAQQLSIFFDQQQRIATYV